MVVFSGRALALTILVWSMIKVWFDRAFGVKTGLPLFHENYDADRLPPVDRDERAQMPAFSRCIACGRCDLGEAERMARSNGAYPGLMAIVLAGSRSMPDHDAAARALAHVPDEVLAQKETICPTRVPFLDLARFVRRKAELSTAPARKALPMAGAA
ncbi:MAG: hypothetical protein U0359_14270 [Byssovorax sp.]